MINKRKKLTIMVLLPVRHSRKIREKARKEKNYNFGNISGLAKLKEKNLKERKIKVIILLFRSIFGSFKL